MWPSLTELHKCQEAAGGRRAHTCKMHMCHIPSHRRRAAFVTARVRPGDDNLARYLIQHRKQAPSGCDTRPHSESSIHCAVVEPLTFQLTVFDAACQVTASATTQASSIHSGRRLTYPTCPPQPRHVPYVQAIADRTAHDYTSAIYSGHH
jgi:hypothetical protein